MGSARKALHSYRRRRVNVCLTATTATKPIDEEYYHSEGTALSTTASTHCWREGEASVNNRRQWLVHVTLSATSRVSASSPPSLGLRSVRPPALTHQIREALASPFR
jgi:hypothetical protein